MGSAGNSNQYPWPPYESFKDCSQGICSIYCPQWCYMIFAPPPPFEFGNNSEQGPGINLSPLIIALISIVASVCILVTCYVVISKFCRRRSTSNATDIDREANPNSTEPLQGNNVGMEESLINSITVHKYRKNDGVVEGTDCSVCLSEFQENESLRLLPKCSHAFHVPCIDAWLKSHSSCPLCRSNAAAAAPVAMAPAPPPRPHNQQQQVSPAAEDNPTQQENIDQYQHTSNGSILVVQDRQDESFRVRDHEIQGSRRSVSLIEMPNSSQSDDEDDEDLEKQIEHNLQLPMDQRERHFEMQHFEVSMETGSSKEVVWGEHSSKFNNIRNGVVSLVKGPLGLKRSTSTGRFGVTRNAKESSSVIPS